MTFRPQTPKNVRFFLICYLCKFRIFLEYFPKPAYSLMTLKIGLNGPFSSSATFLKSSLKTDKTPTYFLSHLMGHFDGNKTPQKESQSTIKHLFNIYLQDQIKKQVQKDNQVILVKGINKD